MVVAPTTAYFFNKYSFRTDSAIYWAEFCGIYAFGLYWVTKTFEIKEIQKDQTLTPEFAGKPKLTIA